MRQLLPPSDGEVTVEEAYGRMEPPAGRPAVRLNMIASADGAASAGGLSGALGGPADKVLFAALRSLADAIVVGAGTWRAEGYGPVKLDPAGETRRRKLGLAPVPPIAVVTISCRLDWDRPFFTQAVQRPLVITAEAAPADRRSRAAEVADVIVAGEEGVDLRMALAALAERGFSNVLCEGGPRLATDLAVGGLLDELCMTISRILIGGKAQRILDGPEVVPPAPLELLRVLEADGFLFLRYAVASPT